MDLSNSAVNKIGNIIRRGKEDSDFDDAVGKLNIWREAHGTLLDEYYDKCVNLAKGIDDNIIVAQRLKRLPTIIGKLGRFRTMRLSSMQDIAGVRIIVNNMGQLDRIEEQILKWDNRYDIDDYIDKPKKSGYRGKHFIFKKNGMFVEIQLRTGFQHLWATSVETTDIFRGASLKERDDNSYWHDFFCQVSSLFAVVERTPVLSKYNKKNLEEIANELEDNIIKNDIRKQMTSFVIIEPMINNEKLKDSYYAVLTLNYKKKMAMISGYKEKDYDLAFEEYKNREKKKSLDEQTVLVAVNKIKKIRDAYPNYFMNIDTFLKIVSFLLENIKKKGKI